MNSTICFSIYASGELNMFNYLGLLVFQGLGLHVHEVDALEQVLPFLYTQTFSLLLISHLVLAAPDLSFFLQSSFLDQLVLLL